MLNILVMGDIVGKPGRKAVRDFLPEIISNNQIDFVIANAENASGGRGLNKDSMMELLSYGIDVLTMGNHVWDNKDIFSFIDEQEMIIRPCNYPENTPGRGYGIFARDNGKRIAVINASGRIFMDCLESPFQRVDSILKETKDLADIFIIDFHAEATSEKLAFAYYFDGRVDAVLGTHTHIQTADERILPGGTAYITDLGMTGPVDSILGMDKNLVIKKFLTQLPVRLEVSKAEGQLEGVILMIDDTYNGIANIRRISTKY